MTTEEKLTDQHNAWIARHLSANQVKMMAVIYMKMDQSTLENFTSEANGDQEELIRLLFKKWRNITNATLQDLANILDDSEIIDTEKIEEILKVQPQPFKFIPETKPKLAEWELGWLAKEIGPAKVKTLAENCFGKRLSSTQIENFKSNHPGDSWNVSFDILVQWNRKTKDSRQVFLQYLKDNPDIKNPNDLDFIFGCPKNGSDSPSGTEAGKRLAEELDTDLKGLKKVKSLFSGKNKGQPSPEPEPTKNKGEGEDFPDAEPADQGDYYDMSADPPGYVLLIDNVQFQGLK